jgi:hypothetical protein
MKAIEAKITKLDAADELPTPKELKILILDTYKELKVVETGNHARDAVKGLSKGTLNKIMGELEGKFKKGNV